MGAPPVGLPQRSARAPVLGAVQPTPRVPAVPVRVAAPPRIVPPAALPLARLRALPRPPRAAPLRRPPLGAGARSRPARALECRAGARAGAGRARVGLAALVRRAEQAVRAAALRRPVGARAAVRGGLGARVGAMSAARLPPLPAGPVPAITPGLPVALRALACAAAAAAVVALPGTAPGRPVALRGSVPAPAPAAPLVGRVRGAPGVGPRLVSGVRAAARAAVPPHGARGVSPVEGVKGFRSGRAIHEGVRGPCAIGGGLPARAAGRAWSVAAARGAV